MPDDTSIPATKGDFQHLNQTLQRIVVKLEEHDQRFVQMDERFDKMGQRIESSEEHMLFAVDQLQNDMSKRIEESERHMLYFMENLRNDVSDMYTNQLSLYDDRIKKLEVATGLAA